MVHVNSSMLSFLAGGVHFLSNLYASFLDAVSVASSSYELDHTKSSPNPGIPSGEQLLCIAASEIVPPTSDVWIQFLFDQQLYIDRLVPARNLPNSFFEFLYCFGRRGDPPTRFEVMS